MSAPAAVSASTPRGSVEKVELMSGKRERKRKKFWDEQQQERSQQQHATSKPSSDKSSPPPSKNARRNSDGAAGGGGKKSSAKDPSTPSSSKASKASSSASSSSAAKADGGGSSSKKEGRKSLPSSSEAPSKSKLATATLSNLSGKFPSKLPYLLFDMDKPPEEIAKQMVEGHNVPGPGVAIPVDSTMLPDGWEKRAIQRNVGVTKGKWDIFILSPTKKSFRSKMDLQRYLDDNKTGLASENFDFSLDSQLKKLRQIWKQYLVLPKKAAASSAASSGSTGVTAGNTASSAAAASSSSTAASASTTASNSASNSVPPSPSSIASAAVSASGASLPPSLASLAPTPLQQDGTKKGSGAGAGPSGDYPGSSAASDGGGESSLLLDSLEESSASLVPEFAVESETGQGLRCTIDGCGKLFRNDRLISMHVKHYHPQFYESLMQRKNAVSVSDELHPETESISPPSGGV